MTFLLTSTMTRWPCCVFALAVAVLSASCSPEAEQPGGPGGAMVAVVVSTGSTPVYAWTGTTAVSVSVAHASAPAVEVWGISSPVGRNIQSGLRHGVVPAGAVETDSIERVLTPGVRYRVTVSLADRTTGFLDFTP